MTSVSPATSRPTPAELAATIVGQLHGPGWKLDHQDESVAVYSNRQLGAPVTGYRTVTHHDLSVSTLADFLGDGLLEAFALLNARFAFGEDLTFPVRAGPRPGPDRLAEDDLPSAPRIVRTGFTMPLGFQSREFVHLLVRHPIGDDCEVIGYAPVPDEGLPPPRPGFLRCPIYPSGQRIQRLPDGRTRVEHLMTYALGGGVPHWAQNALFHRGHVGAYRDEWTRLVAWSKEQR